MGRFRIAKVEIDVCDVGLRERAFWGEGFSGVGVFLSWSCRGRALGTRLDMSTAYHPQLDGQCERIIQTLENMLHTHVIDYTNVKRKPLEFQVEDRVMLKVSPWKGVIRFGKRGKLSPRYIGLFKIMARIVKNKAESPLLKYAGILAKGQNIRGKEKIKCDKGIPCIIWVSAGREPIYRLKGRGFDAEVVCPSEDAETNRGCVVHPVEAAEQAVPVLHDITF
ncbi:putative reverse transcriptase domain-containing protein [Tanacetum coccineum]